MTYIKTNGHNENGGIFVATVATAMVPEGFNYLNCKDTGVF